MKLHLPSSLRKALLAVMAAAAAVSAPAWGSIMHSGATLLTYTDFGSNMGRYTIYQQNELLQHLNQGGIKISYTYKDDVYTLEHGMISYESMVDGGPFTAIAYNATATVQHNGVTNPVFTGRFIGSDKSIHYAGIEYRSCTENKFLLTPQIDYKITRLSKIITDITPSSVYDAAAHRKAGEDIGDMLQYRAGGGYMQRADESGKTTWLTGAYTYVVGGIVDNWSFGYSSGYDYETGTAAKTDGRGTPDDSYTLSIMGVKGWEPGTAGTETHPLPFVTQGGDSGSPVWVWNEASGAYELISCHQARGGYDSYSRGASEWTKLTLDSFCVKVDMNQAEEHTVHIGEVVLKPGTDPIQAVANGSTPVETTPKYGTVNLGGGSDPIEFVGIEHGTNTWNNLYALKDTQNWYAYGNAYLNTDNNEGGSLQYADLFETRNLVFESSAASNSIILDATVDLGIGYAEFSAKEGSAAASYTISGKDNENTLQFNHAGYIVDAGAEVHLKLTNRESCRVTVTDGETQRTEDGFYMREWRKTGAGNLYLEGMGNNEIFLNVGGKGTTYLREKDGYAAYNVLINNGATVDLGGMKNQVERDVTFGYGGGKLDFAGSVDMVWNNANTAEAEGFTIHALTQDAVVTNTSGTTTLTYNAGEDTRFLGSFQDGGGSGALRVVYDAAGKTWTLNSIHTKLQNAESGLTVQTGTVVLSGTNTEHAQGSLNGYNQQRYSNADDWHYADAEMAVDIKAGAIFELGSHARLTGTVAVENGGTFLMREGVRHEMEYIEGWYCLENTYDIAEYYGLHGDVNLKDSGSAMVVKFSEATDANTTLKGDITGAGSMTVDTAQGSLTLCGKNVFSGEKSVTRGTLILGKLESAGNVDENKWKIGASAWMTVNGATAEQALSKVDAGSEGVLALSQDETGAAVNLEKGGYGSLIIGAKDGSRIEFGVKDTENTLASVDGNWNLGGGGGTLVVNYALKGHATLVLGNEHTTGSVILTNTTNDIGSIEFAGKVTLDYTDSRALGGSNINLGYSNRIMGATDTISRIDGESEGVMLLDRMASEDVDLGKHAGLHLGADSVVEYAGRINLGSGDTYNFGGVTGKLVLLNALEDNGQQETNLWVDAQTYSGGVVELKHALGITGHVAVMGDREAAYGMAADSDGSITLRLGAANSFATAGSLNLFAGGIVDINGYDQELSSYYTYAGSAIIDSSQGKSGTVMLKGGSIFNVIEGSLDVGRVVIDCEGFMSLGGDSTYRELVIQNGDVAVNSDKALCATGKTIVESGALLRLAEQRATAELELRSGSVSIGTSLHGPQAGGSLGGTLYVADDGTGTLQFEANSTVSAMLRAGKDATLKLTGNHTGVFTATVMNEEGGTIDVALAEMQFKGSADTAVGGKLNLVGQNGSLVLSSYDARNNTLREINSMHLEDGLNLTIREQTWNTIWNIHELTGNGNITWDSKTIHWYSARLVLDGENSFTGTFTAKRNLQDSLERTYGAYLELAHDKAAQNASIILDGKDENNRMTLAVNTERSAMQALEGNAFSAIYAGVAIEGANNNSSSIAVFQAAPVSTRQATIAITGSGEHDFRGNIYAGEGSAGICIEMAGTGTQKFSGSEVSVSSVTARQGTLVLSSDSLAIADRATIYGGARLGTDGKAFELKDSMTLMVAGSGERPATLDATLKLAGGSLGFDGNALSTADYALAATGLDKGGQSGLNVLFESTSSIRETTYKLASGSGWTSIDASNYTASGLDYYNAEFSTDDTGLSVTFNLKTDNNIWMGTEQKTSWDNSNFGVSAAVPGEGKTAVFNDLAESQSVQVQGDQAAARLLFDATKDYTVGGSGDASLSADSLLQTGNGTTKLGSGVSIEGMADMRAGTLVMQDGSSIGSATVAEAATLRLESAEALSSAGTVEGRGNVQVAWDEGRVGSLHTAEDGIGSLSVESGTLKVTDALTVHREIVVGKDAALQSTTGSILGKEPTAELHLGGTLKLEIASHQDMTDNVVAVTGEDGQELKGRIEKSGSANLTVKNSVVADTILVSGGTLTVADDSVVADFLNNVDTVEVASGARFVVGRGNYTVQDDGFATNLKVSGNGSNLELSVAQHTSKTFEGTVSVTDGGKLSKYDGGVVLTGNATLGSGEGDKVTLSGNWGKSGMQFVGLVEGDGTVNLNSVGYGGSTERFAFSNDGNTFQGKFDVNNRTRLVAGSDKALQYADVDLKNGGGLLVAADNAHINNLNGVAGSVIELDNGRTEGTLTVNQEVAGEYAGSLRGGVSLTKDGVADLTLSGDNSAFNGKLSVQEGTLHVQNTAGISGMEIADGATLDLGGDTRISARGGQGLGSGSFLMQTGEAGSSISGGDGAAARLENAAVDLANGTRLEMENITLAASASVSDASRQATLAAKSLRIEAQVGDNLVSASSVSARMQPLTYGLDMPQPRLAAAAADEVVSYTLANVSGVSLAGDSLMISLVDGVSAWNGADWMAVSLADGGTFSEALSVTMLFTDAEGQAMAVQGVYTLDDAALAAEAEQPHNHVYFRLSGAAQVPEPTTGALSLLALAALAARRRRK